MFTGLGSKADKFAFEVNELSMSKDPSCLGQFAFCRKRFQNTKNNHNHNISSKQWNYKVKENKGPDSPLHTKREARFLENCDMRKLINNYLAYSFN